MPRLRPLLLPGLLTLALIAGCGDDDASSTPGSTDTSTTAPDPPEQESTAEKPAVELYFTSGEQFAPVAATEPSGQGDAELEGVTEQLLRGPGGRKARDPDVKLQTTIPAGTKVENVKLERGGTAEVEVSPEFLDGIPPDPDARNRDQQTELDARVGQVAHTLDQFDRVKATKVISGGVAAAPAVAPKDYGKPAGQPKTLRNGKGGAGSAKQRSGSSSVKKLQKRLAKLRYLPRGAVDGVDGYRTRQAVIAFQSWEKLDRDGVVGPMTTAALKRAKPPKPKLGGPSRRLEVYREKGVLLLVKGDETKRAIHVSTGAPGTETPRGRYEVFRKELKSWSVPFQTWLPYASYFFQGIAFHEYADVPTFPASHGCVRVPAPEAPKVYEFAGIGTAVAVR